MNNRRLKHWQLNCFYPACIESIPTLSPTGLLCLSSLIVYVELFAYLLFQKPTQVFI